MFACLDDMNYGLNPLNGGYMGDYIESRIEVIGGDTRSLDMTHMAVASFRVFGYQIPSDSGHVCLCLLVPLSLNMP